MGSAGTEMLATQLLPRFRKCIPNHMGVIWVSYGCHMGVMNFQDSIKRIRNNNLKSWRRGRDSNPLNG